MNILYNGAIALYHGDCLDVMHEIPDGSVDAIICDLPYGTTACKWDVVIPFEPMWIQLKRIIKPRGAIVLFGSQPFTSALVMSNVKMFKYQWVWEKHPIGFLNVHVQPLRCIEDVLVFSLASAAPSRRIKDVMTYNPQGVNPVSIEKWNGRRDLGKTLHRKGPRNQLIQDTTYFQVGTGYPRNLLRFGNDRDGLHPTQKPVALLEYLIRTYTNEGETVLDFTFGSCSAGVAALTTKRRFIGIERDDTYYALGVQRVQTAIDNLPPMDV